MTSDELKALFNNASAVELDTANEQDPRYGLRLVLSNPETDEVGLLAIEPRQLVLPDEVVLDYSYQMLNSPFSTPPDECLIADLVTRVGPDYDPTGVPFLKDGQGGLF